MNKAINAVKEYYRAAINRKTEVITKAMSELIELKEELFKFL